MPFEDREREGNPPEYPAQLCELCNAEIPVDSKSWCYCDPCFDERAVQRRRNELNETLAEIGGRL